MGMKSEPLSSKTATTLFLVLEKAKALVTEPPTWFVFEKEKKFHSSWDLSLSGLAVNVPSFVGGQPGISLWSKLVPCLTFSHESMDFKVRASWG